MTQPIRNYGLIGDQQTAALISLDGSLDWLPAPHLDSPGVFSAILDPDHGGHWSIQPTDQPFTNTQHYQKNTNVLITTFTTATGTCTITDFMPPTSSPDTCRIYRRVTGQQGTVNLTVTITPRFDFARGQTTLSTTNHTLTARHPAATAHLKATVPWNITNQHATAHLAITAAQTHDFVLTVSQAPPPSPPPSPEDALAETTQYWQQTIARYQPASVAPHHTALATRSLLALHLMINRSHGTIAAAPTTSLPEAIGGERNWDYRYNWLRDTGLVLQTLLKWQHIPAATTYWENFKREILDDIVADPAAMQCIYGLRWQRNLQEEELNHLTGYANSRPVHIGNGAFRQRQWDNYGVILDFIWHLTQHNRPTVADPASWRLIHTLAEHVITIWDQPDEGIWEVRGPARHFVYSKVMCWVTLDRAARLAKKFGHAAHATRWHNHAAQLKQVILQRGWNKSLQSFTQSFDDDALDSSLLRLSTVGFVDGHDPKMISTINRIEERLGVGNGLLLRYRTADGLDGHEGAFLVTSFWLVDALILAGQPARAAQLFDQLTSQTNHLGLLAEEIDPHTNAFLGNFPQAYSHMGILENISNFSTHASATPETAQPNLTKEKIPSRQTVRKGNT